MCAGPQLLAMILPFNICLQAKEVADDLIRLKDTLKVKKDEQEVLAGEKLATLNLKLKSVGNYVHPSVPVSSTEVRLSIICTNQSL